MKTVMKKMFCLMLVAVLLVGVMPFQAFAAEETKSWPLSLTAGETYSVDAIKAEKYSGSSSNYWVHLRNTEDYLDGETFEAIEGGDYTLYVVETIPDEPTTEPTTAPTTEPTTAPTTEPTTAPTTEPTTAPTTEPTTAPTTAPTTEPTVPQNGNTNGGYNLKVYATMWTGDGREETVYLGTFQGLTTNTKIAQYMDQNSNTIDNWVAQVCSGYRWTDGKIYENKWSDDEIEWNDRMGYSNQEAYINVIRDSKDVVIFVHTSRTYVDHDWIKVEGKTTNDTLTLDEAKAIVRKYYKFSSLKMYSNDDWNEYVDGNNNIEPQNAVAIGSGNVTKIHVLITGASANSSSSSSSGSHSTADSSNPKTGDEIFAPVMILGLSASALAVLFYLNKKRAF